MSTKLKTRTAGTVVTLMFATGFAISCSRDKQSGDTVATNPNSAASAASTPVSAIATGPPTTMNVPGVGQVVLDAAIAEKFRQMGGEAVLGLPAGQPKKVGDGTVQSFAKGDIFSSPKSGAHVVRGEILRMYNAQGGPANPLGFPMTDEFEVCGGPKADYGGWGNEFENGYIWWLNWGDAKPTFAGYITGKDRPQGSQCRPPG